jgi:ribonuclease HI
VGWLLDWLGKHKEAERAIMVMSLYHMWLIRNNARDNQVFEQAQVVAERVFRLIDEWMEINAPKGTTSVQRHEALWTPPDEHWLKVNVDGALNKQGIGGGGGVVIRDHHGVFRAGACHAFANISVPEHAELLACRRGVQLAQEIAATKLVLETDNISVAQVLNSSDLDRSRFGPLVQEIKEMISGVAETRVVWARRAANKAAHNLAREGCLFNLCKTWFNVVPFCIRDDIVADGATF